MRSANRKKPSAQKAQKQLTSFFQSKAKSVPSVRSLPVSEQPIVATRIEGKADGEGEKQIALDEERSPSASVQPEEGGKTSKFFDGISRPSKRAKIEESEDFEILEQNFIPNANAFQSTAEKIPAQSKGGNAHLPAHVEELHERFQVLGTLLRIY